MLKKLSFLSCLLALTFAALAQNDSISEAAPKEDLYKRPSFFVLETGAGISHFSDFATSPLSYNGPHMILGIGKRKMDPVREYSFHFQNTIGMYLANSEQMITNSNSFSFRLSHTQLFAIKPWLTEKRSIKVGGMLDLFADFRLNQSLMNHATGFESFQNICGTFQTTWDISREETEVKKWGIFKMTKKPIQRFIEARFDLGLVNSHLRNGYNYAGQGQLINDMKVLDDYHLSSFSGYRFLTSISYNVYRPSGNILSFAYKWDAMRTGGEAPTFQTAYHHFSVSLMIHTNPNKGGNHEE